MAPPGPGQEGPNLFMISPDIIRIYVQGLEKGKEKEEILTRGPKPRALSS
jgi:hypothetical protein